MSTSRASGREQETGGASDPVVCDAANAPYPDGPDSGCPVEAAHIVTGSSEHDHARVCASLREYSERNLPVGLRGRWCPCRCHEKSPPSSLSLRNRRWESLVGCDTVAHRPPRCYHIARFRGPELLPAAAVLAFSLL